MIFSTHEGALSPSVYLKHLEIRGFTWTGRGRKTAVCLINKAQWSKKYIMYLLRCSVREIYSILKLTGYNFIITPLWPDPTQMYINKPFYFRYTVSTFLFILFLLFSSVVIQKILILKCNISCPAILFYCIVNM